MRIAAPGPPQIEGGGEENLGRKLGAATGVSLWRDVNHDVAIQYSGDPAHVKACITVAFRRSCEEEHGKPFAELSEEERRLAHFAQDFDYTDGGLLLWEKGASALVAEWSNPWVLELKFLGSATMKTGYGSDLLHALMEYALLTGDYIGFNCLPLLEPANVLWRLRCWQTARRPS